ncbi:VanW family protein [Patescibacteria group bacterium]|nr:VanW family protein [Patescibacteria group bacterium]
MKAVISQIKSIPKAAKVFFWFSTGALLGLFLFISFSYLIFQRIYSNTVYPGVTINGIGFGGKKETQVRDYFAQRNKKIAGTKFVFQSDAGIATISAREIDFGYNENLLAAQAISLGRSRDTISNISFVLQAYINTVNLPPSYYYSESKFSKILSPIVSKLQVEPVDALFTFQNGRVTAFKPSNDGQTVDMEELKSRISSKFLTVVSSSRPQTLAIEIPVGILKPKITTDKANNLGIKELLASGTSLFQHSIPSRIYNVSLASTRLNGILIAPGEVFSFGKALGDVSAFTGYQQAYVIQNGKTVLGDGGGVCQVSTTFFRALLNAGLPIIERHAHAYRVGYYEQDSPPGLDATVFVPSVDLKFKNDTGNYILVQTSIDPNILKLTFELYGTKDGREVVMSKPVVTNETPAPPDAYQDDPTLPKGQVKQVDFAAAGANVYFTRQVTKNGKVIISDKFVSDFQPWQAVYLRGTKE